MRNDTLFVSIAFWQQAMLKNKVFPFLIPHFHSLAFSGLFSYLYNGGKYGLGTYGNYIKKRF
jgi:hypothetical protein